MLTQFFRFNLKLKVSTASLLNSEVEKYLSWLWSSVVAFLSFIIFWVIVSFLTKLLTLGILFSTGVWAQGVAKLVILGISPFTSFF